MKTTVQNLEIPEDSILMWGANEELSAVKLLTGVEWTLSCGPVLPQFDAAEGGRRQHAPVYFHPNGNVRSLPLQERSPIAVGEEILPAELVTFHASGEVRRVFPSAGKLSAYWTEEQEMESTPWMELPIGGVRVPVRCINAEFFPSGALASLTLWPGETLRLNTNVGKIFLRSGIAFYENGHVRSYEPAEPVSVQTPLGNMMAYHTSPLGISGDLNSLRYREDGKVRSFITMESTLEILDGSVLRQFGPYKTQSYCEEADTEVKGMQVEFDQENVYLRTQEEQSFSLKGLDCTVGQSKLRYGAVSCGTH